MKIKIKHYLIVIALVALLLTLGMAFEGLDEEDREVLPYIFLAGLMFSLMFGFTICAIVYAIVRELMIHASRRRSGSARRDRGATP
jgi:uncharacterized membrane protein